MELGHIQGLPKFFWVPPIIYLEWIKLRTSNLAGTFTGPVQIKPIKNFGEKGAWPPLPRDWGLQLSYPSSQEQNFKFGGYIYTANPNKSPLKLWRKWSVGISRDCPNFWVPPIISGMGKAMDFKFGGYIYRASPNKSPLKILEKKEHRHIQGLPKVLGYLYYLRNR